MQRTIASESPTWMTEGWVLQTSLHNWTHVVKKKNVSTSTLRWRLYEVGLYGRIAVKKLLLRKQNNVKRIQWAKAHKNWIIEQWNKVLSTDKSNFEIFQSNRRVCAAKTWQKSWNPLYHTKHKAWKRLCYGVGAFANYIVKDLHQLKGKLNQSCYHSIRQHHAIPFEMQLVSQGFLFMQDNDTKHTSKFCQIY